MDINFRIIVLLYQSILLKEDYCYGIFIPESLHTVTECYGGYLTINCSNSEKIFVKSVIAGAKRLSDNCQGSNNDSNAAGCCTRNEMDDCHGDFIGGDIDPTMFKSECIGRQVCSNNSVDRMRTSVLNCTNSSSYTEYTHYMGMEYYCIKLDTIDILSGANKENRNNDSMVYLLGNIDEGVNTSIPTNQYSCSVETGCGEAINIHSLDFRFPIDNGSCSTENTLSIQDNVLVNFTCTSNNNFVIKPLYHSDRNYISLTYHGRVPGGFLWLAFRSNGNLTLNCPLRDPVQECLSYPIIIGEKQTTIPDNHTFTMVNANTTTTEETTMTYDVTTANEDLTDNDNKTNNKGRNSSTGNQTTIEREHVTKKMKPTTTNKRLTTTTTITTTIQDGLSSITREKTNFTERTTYGQMNTTAKTYSTERMADGQMNTTAKLPTTTNANSTIVEESTPCIEYETMAKDDNDNESTTMNETPARNTTKQLVTTRETVFDISSTEGYRDEDSIVNCNIGMISGIVTGLVAVLLILLLTVTYMYYTKFVKKKEEDHGIQKILKCKRFTCLVATKLKGLREEPKCLLRWYHTLQQNNDVEGQHSIQIINSKLDAKNAECPATTVHLDVTDILPPITSEHVNRTSRFPAPPGNDLPATSAFLDGNTLSKVSGQNVIFTTEVNKCERCERKKMKRKRRKHIIDDHGHLEDENTEEKGKKRKRKKRKKSKVYLSDDGIVEDKGSLHPSDTIVLKTLITEPGDTEYHKKAKRTYIDDKDNETLNRSIYDNISYVDDDREKRKKKKKKIKQDENG